MKEIGLKGYSEQVRYLTGSKDGKDGVEHIWRRGGAGEVRAEKSPA